MCSYYKNWRGSYLNQLLELSLDIIQTSDIIPGDVGHLNNRFPQCRRVALAQGPLHIHSEHVLKEGPLSNHTQQAISAAFTLKSSIVTASEFMTSASMVSSSRSIRSIFFLIACSAASEQRAARSAPTWPWVSLATYRQHTCGLGSHAYTYADCHTESRLRLPGKEFPQTCSKSTSSASFMFLVWIWRISNLPVASGMPMSTSLSKRPVGGRGSETHVRFHHTEHELWLFYELYSVPYILNGSISTLIKQLTKSPECWIDAVGSVCGSHDNDMGSLFQTVHESQQLRNNAPLNLSVGLQRKTCTRWQSVYLQNISI